jgi:hypothetical protein
MMQNECLESGEGGRTTVGLMDHRWMTECGLCSCLENSRGHDGEVEKV